MKYRIEILTTAVRDLKKVPRNILPEIDKAILSLADNPRPPGCKKLKGTENRYRIRVRDYRILYEIRDDVLLILIFRVRHRKNAYD